MKSIDLSFLFCRVQVPILMVKNGWIMKLVFKSSSFRSYFLMNVLAEC
jgi:hypothetical protein